MLQIAYITKHPSFLESNSASTGVAEYVTSFILMAGRAANDDYIVRPGWKILNFIQVQGRR